MIDAPRTLEEAQKYRYGQWAGNPKGRSYVDGHCAYEVREQYSTYQCCRKNGHGPGGLYCKQHAKIVEK